jgi:hypothetical protein
MNNDQLDQLQLEVDKGNKASTAYKSYLKTHFDERKQALFDNFMKEKSLPVREVISTTLNAILAIEKSILTDIDTGRMAAKTIGELEK